MAGRYGIKMEYRPRPDMPWRETVLRNRFADRRHAEAFAAEMNARGGRAAVIDHGRKS
jgi:hypothetical protein